MAIERQGWAVLIALVAVAGFAQAGVGEIHPVSDAGPALHDQTEGGAVAASGGAVAAADVGNHTETFAIVATEPGALKYEFTVRGDVSMTEVHEKVGASSANDAVTDHGNGTVTVSGFTGNPGYGDAYEIDGTIESFAVTGGDAAFELFLGGEHVTDEWVDQRRDVPTVFEITATEAGEVSYRFTVDGNVSITGINETVGAATVNDRIVTAENGTTVVEGFTGNPGYGDAYVIEGEVTAFERTGGNASFELFRDGDRVTAALTTSVDRVWNRSLDEHFRDGASDVATTPDGGFLVAGRSLTADGSAAATVVKLTADGETEWVSTVGEPCNQTVTAVAAAGNDSFVVTGTTVSAGDEDAWVARGTADGDLVWSRSFGGDGDDFASDVIETDGEHYVVAGQYVAEHEYGWLLNLTGDGEVVWNRTHEYGEFTAVTQRDSGGYAVAGETDVYPGVGAPFSAWFFLADADGREVTNSTPSGHFASRGRDVVQTGPGRYVLVGWGEPLEGYVVHVNDTGDATVRRTYRGHRDNPYAAGATSVVANGDGSSLVALTAIESTCGLVRVGPDGAHHFRRNVSAAEGSACRLANGADGRTLLVSDSEAIMLEMHSDAR